MNERKLLVYSSIFLALVWIVVVATHKHSDCYSLNVKNQFTYGREDAPFHMILFEEFACPACGLFYRDDLPVIEKEYVEGGRLKVTIIPLAFLEASLDACRLALYIKEEMPSQMKQFYDSFFALPQKMPPFSLTNDATFSDAIEHNLSLAKKIYPGDIHLPIVLVNGKLIKNADATTISKAIDEAL